jgi:serine/threonine-protein kinase HipA
LPLIGGFYALTKKEFPLNLRSANILFKDELAGTLEETETGGTRFVYEPTWRIPIACCFPIERREHDWASGLHPFFQHLGPEGHLRVSQARNAQIDQEDDFGLLLRYGADCIGAVSLVGRGSFLAPTATQLAENPNRTISGVQRKLLVVNEQGAFGPAGPTGPAPYIAKLNEDVLPNLVRNEALSLKWISKILGDREVTRFRIAPIPAIGETAVVVTRFDRTPEGAKLRLEDFAQILVKPRGADFGGKYDAAYEDVAAAITKHSARPIIDLDRFFRRLIAFALVGNCDAHLKNFSLLETPTGLRLSPVYDVVNSALYPGYDQKLALTIAGRRWPIEALNREVLVGFGRSIGLPGPAITLAFDEIKRRSRAAAALIIPPEGEGLDGFITRFGEIVSRGCLNLLA